jgi:hypothetical protein
MIIYQLNLFGRKIHLHLCTSFLSEERVNIKRNLSPHIFITVLFHSFVPIRKEQIDIIMEETSDWSKSIEVFRLQFHTEETSDWSKSIEVFRLQFHTDETSDWSKSIEVFRLTITRSRFGICG